MIPFSGIQGAVSRSLKAAGATVLLLNHENHIYSPRQPSTTSAIATTVCAMASPGKSESHQAR
jgi:hypothetical protein